MDWWYQWPSPTVKVILEGDETRARELWGEANKLLYELKNIMRLGNIQQYKMERVFTDGSVISARSFFGQDIVSIMVPPVKKGEELEVLEPVPVMVTFWATMKWITFLTPEGFYNFYIDLSNVINPDHHFWYFAVVEDDPLFSALLCFDPENLEWYVIKFKVDIKTFKTTGEEAENASINVEDPWDHIVRKYYKVEFEHVIDAPFRDYVHYGGEDVSVPVYQATFVSPKCPARGYFPLEYPGKSIVYGEIFYTIAYFFYPCGPISLPIDGLISFEGELEGDGYAYGETIGGGKIWEVYFTYTYRTKTFPATVENAVASDPRAPFEPIGFAVEKTTESLQKMRWEVFANVDAWYEAHWQRRGYNQLLCSTYPQFNEYWPWDDWGVCYYSIPFGLSLNSEGQYNLVNVFEQMYGEPEIIIDWDWDYGGERWQAIEMWDPIHGIYWHWTYATKGMVSYGGLTWSTPGGDIYYVDKCYSPAALYDAYPVYQGSALRGWLIAFPDYYQGFFHRYGPSSSSGWELCMGIGKTDGLTISRTGYKWAGQGEGMYTGGTSRHHGGGTPSRAMCRQFPAVPGQSTYNKYKNESIYLLAGSFVGSDKDVGHERAAKELLMAMGTYKMGKAPSCDTAVERPSEWYGMGRYWGITLTGKCDGYEDLIGHSVFSRYEYNSPRGSIFSDFAIADGRNLKEENSG